MGERGEGCPHSNLSDPSYRVVFTIINEDEIIFTRKSRRNCHPKRPTHPHDLRVDPPTQEPLLRTDELLQRGPTGKGNDSFVTERDYPSDLLVL